MKARSTIEIDVKTLVTAWREGNVKDTQFAFSLTHLNFDDRFNPENQSAELNSLIEDVGPDLELHFDRGVANQAVAAFLDSIS